MKLLTPALLLLIPLTMDAQPAGSTADPRLRYTINDGWRFSPGGIAFGERPQTVSTGWEPVTIPHTWNATDWLDDVQGYRRGVAWYHRRLALDSALAGRRIFLHFEGVNQTAEVYVNGAFAGRHEGGYTAFTVDITRHLRFGAGENLIAVQVGNAHDPMIAPLSVGYALYGGIYRDVWLVATDPVHVTLGDHGSSGVYITTPRVSRASADVRVRGTLANDGRTTRQLRVVNTVVDAAGRQVATASTSVSAPAGGTAPFSQSLPSVANPRLWSPDQPYLYSIHTDVYDGSTLRDRVTSPLGFRWFSFTPTGGFSLNGEKLQLRGTNRHQDYDRLGSALPNALHRRDLEIIKEMGANFLRLAHYPQDPAVLEAADRLGLLIWEEIPVVNYITVDPGFTERSAAQLREMIRQHHNHPSVVIWGTMNEVFLWSEGGYRIARQGDTSYMRQTRDFARHLDSIARAEDPARYSAMAIHGSGDYDASGVSDAAQIVGLNRYDGWYSGTFEQFGTGLDRRHERRPNEIIFVSEYGAEDDFRVNSLAPERFDFSGTWMRRYHESYLRQINARPWLAGTAIWNQFDFSQPDVGGSISHMNQKGMLTFDREPKDLFYLYKANWNPEPMVYIASRTWTRRTGTDSTAPRGAGPRPVSQPVDVYSNLPQVELLVNGRSLGVRQPDDVKRVTFEVPFVDGENVLEARGVEPVGSGGVAPGRAAPVGDRLSIDFSYRPPVLADTSVPFRELAVNVGVPAEVVGAGGVIWVGDRPYRAGGFGHVGGEPKQLNKDIAIKGTTEPPVYFTHRVGLEAYRFDVPDGRYEVELRFTEPTAAPGERVFGIAINGRRVLNRLDLAAQAGIARAVPIIVEADAIGGRGLTINFPAERGQPVLSGVRVRKL